MCKAHDPDMDKIGEPDIELCGTLWEAWYGRHIA